MKKLFYVIALIIIGADLIYGFVTNQEVGGFFGFELDIWTHRMILILFMISLGWGFYRQNGEQIRD
ncbi:MAG: hypothetical protein WBB24_00030 [Maribacter sp.]